jgi:tRNA pseudouridine38-40 synthase
MRFFAEIAYEGSDFHGWQKQENAHSVQAEIEAALGPLLKESTTIQGCGRTDTGVHASQYFFHFDGDAKDKMQMVYSLNNILPKSIAVLGLWEVNSDTHARFDAESRSYRYHIHQKKDPFSYQTSWFFQRELDIVAMNEACELLKNHTDFASFCKSKSDNRTNLCDVTSAKWTKDGSKIYFDITANRFLRNMVRAIVGTMLEIGIGKMNLEQFNDVIEAKDRREAGFSVPAHGLFLTQVGYPTEHGKAINTERENGSGKAG